MSAANFVAATAVGLAVALAARSVLLGPVGAVARIRPYTLASRIALGQVVAATEVGSTRVGVDAAGLTRSFLVGLVRRIVDHDDDEGLRRTIEQAGGGDVEAQRQRELRSAGVVASVGLLGGAVVLHSPLVAVVLAAAGYCVGIARSRGALDRAIAQRRERMELELLTIDMLLALYVRSGAGPAQAVQRLCARGHGEIVGELRGVLDATRAGVRDADAFRNAAERTPCPAAARVYAMFATASERGSDLGAGLLDAARDLRVARREELRRRATRRRAAMLVPTIGVLAPIMLLFVAAPLPSIILGNH
mgnify:CR=1 FL=1